jgi:hypothetical protein
VVTNTLNDGSGARVSDSETLCSHSTEEAGPASSAVQTHIADENILFCLENGSTRRVNDQAATGEALSNIIVGIAFEFQSNAWGKEGTE